MKRNDVTVATIMLARTAGEAELLRASLHILAALGMRVWIAAPADYSFGPFLMRATLAAHVARIPSNAGWGSRHFMFGLAHRLGYRVLHVDGDYACPPDQRVEDEAERLHRLRQLAQNVDGLVRGMTTAI